MPNNWYIEWERRQEDGMIMDSNLLISNTDYSAYRLPQQDEADEIAHPFHYNTSSVQPIDVIEAWSLSYHLGNVLKYLARHQHKGNPLKDLKKARWYLEREIARLEKEEGF